jgi:CDP-glucose 4,6-dehydratase
VEGMEMKGVNILVTGGCGFIGGQLVTELVRQNANVTVIDIFLDPRSIFARNNLGEKTNLKFVDIRDRERVLEIFKKYKPSYVIHLAAEPIVEKAYQDPYSVFDINIMGTVNILDAVRMFAGVKGIIVASSDKAYGKTDIAYRENLPLRGDHPYDVSKSCGDLIAQAYHKTYGLPVVITRFGNVYGEGDLYADRIIPGICEAIIKNKCFDIRSDGTYVRDYLYIKDVVNGYIFLLKNLSKIEGEAFNFSSNDTLSILDVVKKIEKVLNLKISYKILNTAKNEIPYQHLNDSKIRKLGWASEYSIKTTIPAIINWYRNVL